MQGVPGRPGGVPGVLPQQARSPLGSLNKIYAKLADFEARGSRPVKCLSWSDKGSCQPGNGALQTVIDMTAFATVEEVETLGELDRGSQ